MTQFVYILMDLVWCIEWKTMNAREKERERERISDEWKQSKLEETQINWTKTEYNENAKEIEIYVLIVHQLRLL